MEVTFKGTLLLNLKGVQAVLTLSPDFISYGSNPWAMLKRFFDQNNVIRIETKFCVFCQVRKEVNCEILKSITNAIVYSDTQLHIFSPHSEDFKAGI